MYYNFYYQVTTINVTRKGRIGCAEWCCPFCPFNPFPAHVYCSHPVDETMKVLDVAICLICPVSATLQDHGWRDVLPSLWSCLRFYPPDNLIVSESPDGNGAAAAMALTSNFHVIFTASVGFRRLCFYDLKQVSGWYVTVDNELGSYFIFKTLLTPS